ncbi:hypothetical protein [Streptomyces sp. NPDC014733]|uniref:hypothetical protein n=1 Tax=Streptomyces sp. NPDC014733 TaxID=3364885 RepID=UPI003701F3D4
MSDSLTILHTLGSHSFAEIGVPSAVTVSEEPWWEPRRQSPGWLFHCAHHS